MSSYSKGSVVVALTAVACFVIAGCGSENASSDESAGGTAGSNESAATGSDSAAAIDACSLLSAEDISALLGVSVEGTPPGSDPLLCFWDSPATNRSVSVEIGPPDTAINGTLPPPEPGYPEVGTPGPDGMRFLGGGMVEFAAGRRSNTVQVVVLSMTGDEANAAAVELARKIGPQLPN